MVQFFGHSSLHLFLQDGVACVLEERDEQVIGAHDAVVGLVEQECVAHVDVLLDEDQASLAVFARRQTFLLRLLQELGYVIISEIAKHPLDPDGVVLVLILELLQALQVKVARLGHVVLRLIQLDR